MKKAVYFVLLSFLLIDFSFCKEVEVKFKDLNRQSGKPLMEALDHRETNRDFSRKPIDDGTLGNLLWATAGINRSNGKRTFPTAMNTQDIDLYVIKNDGSWIYNPRNNSIIKISDSGMKRTGAVDLVYVVNLEKSKGMNYSAMHAGSMYQNASLYCASEGLNNVVKASFDEKDLTKKLKLEDNQKILVTQKVGWPK